MQDPTSSFGRFWKSGESCLVSQWFLRLTCQCSGREKYIPAYNSQLKREILFRVFPHHLPGDNPQQAESASGIGGNGNLNCIRDKSGGTKELKESDKHYHALFAVSDHQGFTRKRTQTELLLSLEKLAEPCKRQCK